jgi:hypothetical protein
MYVIEINNKLNVINHDFLGLRTMYIYNVNLLALSSLNKTCVKWTSTY